MPVAVSLPCMCFEVSGLYVICDRVCSVRRDAMPVINSRTYVRTWVRMKEQQRPCRSRVSAIAWPKLVRAEMSIRWQGEGHV